MKRYIALLRGVNISGRNKLSMAALKQAFESLGFDEVKTCLNSGNVVFSAAEEDIPKLTERIAAMLERQFELTVPVLVLLQEALKDLLRHAPGWWGDGGTAVYDNLIFLLPPATFDEVFQEIGEPREGLEQIAHYGEAIFWSFCRKDYQKTNWWPGTAKAPVCFRLTIRTANTVRRLAAL